MSTWLIIFQVGAPLACAGMNLYVLHQFRKLLPQPKPSKAAEGTQTYRTAAEMPPPDPSPTDWKEAVAAAHTSRGTAGPPKRKKGRMLIGGGTGQPIVGPMKTCPTCNSRNEYALQPVVCDDDKCPHVVDHLHQTCMMCRDSWAVLMPAISP